MEAGLQRPLTADELDQMVVVAALRLSAYRVREGEPSAAVLKEVSDHIGNLPAGPLSRFEIAHVRPRQKTDTPVIRRRGRCALTEGATSSSGRA